MDFDNNLIKSSTKRLILAVLSDETMYGYQIVKEIFRRSGEEIEMNYGSLYPALHALEKKGHLQSIWKEVDGRKRKYYSLTRKGRIELATQTKEWRRFSRSVNKVMRISR